MKESPKWGKIKGKIFEGMIRLKKAVCVLLGILLVLGAVWFFLPGCGSKELTMEKVIRLSQKGEALDWADFEKYEHIEAGHGLCIRVYEVDDRYCVQVGGPYPGEPAWYVRLVDKQTDQKIDLRCGNVEDWIEEESR